MRHERLHAPQRGRGQREPQGGAEGVRRRPAAFEHDRDHAAEAVEQGRGAFVVRVAGESRMNDPRDAVQLLEPLGQGEGGAVVALHPGRKAANASFQEPRRLRIDRRPVELHHIRDPLDQGAGARHGAGDQVRVAAQVLGRRMDHRLHPVVGRAQVDGRGEGGVGHKGRARFPGGVAGRGDVEDAQGGVGGELQEDHPRARGRRRGPGPGVGGVHEGGRSAAPGKLLGQQRVGGAVDVAAGDDMVSRFRQRQQGHGRGAHAAGKDQRRFGSLQGRDLPRCGELVRVVAVAAVQQRAVAGAGPMEGGAARDRRNHGVAGRRRELAGVDRSGGRARALVADLIAARASGTHGRPSPLAAKALRADTAPPAST